ncbi:MAG: GNAT family N-acetyltransferase [Ruminococcus sp.]|nr:GNAT family N-acetyltransferase [Ruminococcus sp.]
MGKGYGSLLLKSCVGELSGLRFTKLLLWVLEDNKPARKFYEKNGFICTDEYMNDCIGGKVLREVMYTYNIKQAAV